MRHGPRDGRGYAEGKELRLATEEQLDEPDIDDPTHRTLARRCLTETAKDLPTALREFSHLASAAEEKQTSEDDSCARREEKKAEVAAGGDGALMKEEGGTNTAPRGNRKRKVVRTSPRGIREPLTSKPTNDRALPKRRKRCGIEA